MFGPILPTCFPNKLGHPDVGGLPNYFLKLHTVYATKMAKGKLKE